MKYKNKYKTKDKYKTIFLRLSLSKHKYFQMTMGRRGGERETKQYAQ